MKKIVVFGASGRTGKYIVEYALEAGHEVKAFVRNTNSITTTHPQLTIVQGDVTNAAQVADAIAGTDVVVSALGTNDIATDAVNMMSDAMSLIIPAMKQHGVRRVLAIGGLGVLQADEGHQLIELPSYPEEYRNVGMGHNKVYLLLKDGGLDWTLVCCPYIPDAPCSGTYEVVKDYPADGKNQINTGDVADFMVREMTANQYLQTRVGISNY